MNTRLSIAALTSVTLLSFGLIVGCGQQGPTGGTQDAIPPDRGGQQAKTVDPHDAPITEEQKQQLREETAKFADAVARIKKFRDTIHAETKDGLPANPFVVHQALDQADLLAGWLPKIARDSGVPKEHWETINTAANQLRDLFDQVHQNIDNRAAPDFASVQQPIDAKIAELETIAQ